MAFKPKIIKARFHVSPFTSDQMLGIANTVNNSILTRIRRGVNAEDQPAKSLKPGRNGKKGYPEYKIARGLAPLRDWTFSGRTGRSQKVKSVSENRAVIGFTDDRSDLVAHVNNLRERAFGVSPKDREALNKAVLETLREHSIVKAVKVA